MLRLKLKVKKHKELFIEVDVTEQEVESELSNSDQKCWRKRKLPEHLRDYEVNSYTAIMNNVLNSLNEKLKSNKNDAWKKTVDNEMDSMKKKRNGV